MNAEQLALCVREEEFHPLFKSYLLFLARNNPKEGVRVFKELCRQKRATRNPLYGNRRRRELVAAYEEAMGDSPYAPTFSAVKAAYIAKHGKRKWNGGHDDDESLGNFSARKTLRFLGHPLAEGKKGRPKGSKSSRNSGPQALRKAIARK